MGEYGRMEHNRIQKKTGEYGRIRKLSQVKERKDRGPNES